MEVGVRKKGYFKEGKGNLKKEKNANEGRNEGRNVKKGRNEDGGKERYQGRKEVRV